MKNLYIHFKFLRIISFPNNTCKLSNIFFSSMRCLYLDSAFKINFQERRNVQTLEESMPHKERQPSCRVEKEMFVKPAVRPNLITGEIYIPTQVTLRNMRMHESLNGLNSPHSFPRRSFCRAQQNINTSGDENSPVFPTFMAATQSAKATARSMSTPRQHSGFLENCFGQSGPYRNDQLSLWSSYNGESVTNNGKSCILNYL